MRRRRLLSLLAAGAGSLAGCPGFGDRDAETVTPAAVPTVPASRSSPAAAGASDGELDAARRTDVVESAALDRTFAVAVTVPRSLDRRVPAVSVRFAAAATDRHPTLLTGVVENPPDAERAVDISGVPLLAAVPRAPPVDGSAANALVLVPTPNHAMARRTPRAERTADGRWRLATPLDGPLVRVRPDRLPPGSSVRFEYRLVGRHGSDGFPTGQYRFGRAGLTATVGTWRTDRPGPAGSSRFDDPEPPPLTGLGTVTWYHEAGPETSMFLRPGVERTRLPGTVTYRLVNRARTVAGTRWLFLKLVDGRWFDLSPEGGSRYRGLLRLGESETWDLSLSHDAGAADGDVGWLGGGRYAFVVDVGYSDMVHAALLDVEAPRLRVTPRDGLDVAREDSTVTVTHPSWTPDEGTVLALTRASEADRRLIPEVVQRTPALRNTLAFVRPDVETVRFRADRRLLDGLDGEAGTAFRFQGEAYRLRRRPVASRQSGGGTRPLWPDRI